MILHVSAKRVYCFLCTWSAFTFLPYLIQYLLAMFITHLFQITTNPFICLPPPIQYFIITWYMTFQAALTMCNALSTEIAHHVNTTISTSLQRRNCTPLPAIQPPLTEQVSNISTIPSINATFNRFTYLATHLQPIQSFPPTRNQLSEHAVFNSIFLGMKPW